MTLRKPSETVKMTPAQSEELKRLSQDTRQPEAFDETLTPDEADERIRVLKAGLELGGEPPHVL